MADDDRDVVMLSVVIPVYNERATIEELLYRVQAVEIPREILIVDDDSTDGTRELLTDLLQSSGGGRDSCSRTSERPWQRRTSASSSRSAIAARAQP